MSRSSEFFKMVVCGAVVAAVGCEPADNPEETDEQSAALCSGSSCEGQDPAAHGCSNDALELASTAAFGGTLSLRYSPLCGAIWSRLSASSSGAVSLSALDSFSTTNFSVKKVGSFPAWSGAVGATSFDSSYKACAQVGAQKTCTSLAALPQVWSHVAAWKGPSTVAQKNVVEALNKLPTNAPAVASTIGGSPTWLTDTAGGDGGRIIESMKVWKDWCKTPSCGPAVGAPLPATVRALMEAKLTTYSAADRAAIVSRIGAVYLPWNALPAGDLAARDQGVLTLLGIRAQCKEAADRIVVEAGGKPKIYSASSVTLAEARPGMYAFTTTNSHAANVKAILWDRAGQPLKIMLGESNWGSGWSNPQGQVPWQRVYTTTRITPASGYRFVSVD
jgi:hypothetical protein